MTQAWAKGSRRGRLPRDWPKRVRQVRIRARGLCQATHHADQCNGTGSQCDHVIAGDDHSLANLQWLSAPCHDAKTERERTAGLAARDARLRRPPEAPPGRRKT